MSIVQHSRTRATEEAVLLWALASAQYPLDYGVIQEEASVMLIEAISSFALNARRAFEASLERSQIELVQPRWQWIPKTKGEIVVNLWDALNRIIHAKKLEVGWEKLPGDSSVIANGAIVIPYVQAETDRRALAFVDPFALAHAFLYKALPILTSDNAISHRTVE